MEPDPRPSKLEAFRALVRQGATSLCLDARRSGVLVPEHLRGVPNLVLEYGYRLEIPIPDLAASRAGVSATLSFSRTPYPTFVPWDAVYAIFQSKTRLGVIYQEDVPADLDEHVAEPEETGPPPALRLVTPDADLTPGPVPEPANGRPQLRVVK